MKALVSVLALLLCTTVSHAQLGFCNGSKGDPIFFENFGSGTGFGPQLPPGTTSYTYVATGPNDGQYTLSPNVGGTSGSWHNGPDHTPDDQPDGANGKVLLVNASYTAGEFYRREVNGLCVNTTFEFSAWLLNVYNAGAGVCPGSGIPIDVTFEIWDATETTLIKSGSTGPIAGTNSPQWQQFGLVFTVLPGQTSIVLKMKNNGEGGCGNDLAIDDIMFRSCGDTTTLTASGVTGDTYRVCSPDAPASTTLSITIDPTNPHVFQWQSSPDGTVWSDLAGETGLTYATGPVSADTYYRVKVAQDAANLANPFCYTVSEVFSIRIIPQPADPVSAGDVSVCEGNPIPSLTVTVAGSDVAARWYDAPSGGNLLVDGLQYPAPIAGLYYAEAYHTASGCTSANRTAVRLTVFAAPQLPGDETEQRIICENDGTTLDAGLGGVTYDWQPGGATTRTLRVTQAGTYTVTVTNADGCNDSRSFEVVSIPPPTIASITGNGRTVTVEATPPGDYDYSIGNGYQPSNVFENADGGMLEVTVRERNGCGRASQPYFLLVVPTYFTPNGDGHNDVFRIPGFVYVPGTTVQVFDRYGKLVCQLDRLRDSWDGTRGGQPFPADDYWYRVTLPGGEVRTGHFSLVR